MSHHPWISEMIQALVQMRLGGLPDYGRYPSDADRLSQMAEVYCTAIEDKGGIRAFIGPAARIAIRESKEFPSAPAFAEYVLRAMASATRREPLELIDPHGRPVVEILTVRTTATEEQIRRMKDSRVRQLRSLGYGQPALPAPDKDAPATRDQLLELRQRLSGQSRLAKDIDNHPSL